MRGGNEVVVFVTRSPAEVLVARRSGPDGYWHPIAGSVEPGEAAVEAARRELLEETGLDTGAGGPAPTGLSYTYPLAGENAERRALYAPGVDEVRVDCFTARAPAGWEPTLDREHDDHRWCGPCEAAALLRWDDTRRALLRALDPLARRPGQRTYHGD